MIKTKSKILYVLIILIMITSSSAHVKAETNQEKLQRINDEISLTQDDIDKLKDNIDALVAQTNKIDKTIDELEDEIDRINAQIKDTEENLAKTEAELEVAENERIEHKKVADERIKTMYMYGSMDYVQILFSAESISDLISRIDAIQTLTNFDKDTFDELLRIENEIAEKKQKIEDDKVALEDYKSQVQNTYQTQVGIREEKQELMDAMYGNKESLEAVLDQQQADAKAIQKLIIEESVGEDVDYGNEKGHYLWPTPGYKTITSPYGYRIHPVYGYKKFHSGVDIGAANKSKIISPGSGVVILASYYGGYGNTVIVDMGGGVTMLFGHCSSLKVSKGDIVSAGEIIAYVGSTGVSTGPHLHFEVRVNGSTVNPMDWVIY